MSLLAGTRIGNFEVGAPLGAGGMGEVYRAHDSRLDRPVAIKALPERLVRDADRLARFEREARLLASLNHPNIASIYGIEDVADDSVPGAPRTPYLVLELVDGETLTQRIARGALPVREALEIAVQVASAIEAAHGRGVIHRDLKPGNVMVTPSGAVKVLDFGLAKSDGAVSASSSDLLDSPTMGAVATGAGMILGTAPYMSPEQARGHEVDRRADVWAFGCLLMECLTGQPTFAGETVSDVIARILEREPEWSAIPASTPERLRELIRRCLTKDLAARPRDIGDLRLELNAILRDLSAVRGAGPAPVAATPSLAVLYFENLAKDSDSEYFCTGITEDILTDLSKIKGLRVASRNAVSRYRGDAPDIPKVASELNVGAVLVGSVRRAGDRVRITVQLINAADGFQLWAERYDRTLEDVFAVQEEIASSIAAALSIALTPAVSESLRRVKPNDVRAYDLYLKGREQYSRYEKETIRAALDLFQQAIGVDPEYALAWAGMADSYGQLVHWGSPLDAETLIRKGLDAARRAVELDPKLPEAYKAEALVRRMAGDVDGEKAALIKAIQANPKFTPALNNLAVALYSSADLAGAERIFRRIIEIDPQEAFSTMWLANLLFQTGRFDECVATARRVRELSSSKLFVTGAHALQCWVLALRGDPAGARRALSDAAADGADRSMLDAFEAWLAVREGRLDAARALVETVERDDWLGVFPRILAGSVLVRLGEMERARRMFSEVALRGFSSCLIRMTPDVHPLLDHEPFAPRRMAATLVWPLEAPMIDAARHRFFREVRIESGRPEGSDVLSGLTAAS